MKLEKIISVSNPVAYWTGEHHGGGTVFDELDTTPLVNNNAILNEPGATNQNLSQKSINLKGGYLQVNDSTFNEANVVNRTFAISFGFRVKDQTVVSGFKPIVSKWEPDQQYMIGFENGILVAKVKTSNELIELSHDMPKMIYNDRWNWVQLIITPTDISLWLNGIETTVANSDPLATSTYSLFTVGGIGVDTFTDDVLVADISVCVTDNQHFPKASYKLTRSNLEIWQDYAPTHLYFFGDVLDVDGPIPNLGTKDDVAYIVYDPTGAKPYLKSNTIYKSDQVLHFDKNGHITIDTDDLHFDTNEGVTIVCEAFFETPYNSSGPLNDNYLFDLRNNMDNNNGRCRMSINMNGSDQFFGWKFWDATGTVVEDSKKGYSADDYYREVGIKHHVIKSGRMDWIYALNFSKEVFKNSFLNTAMNASLPMTHNKFLSCTNTSDWTEVKSLGYFDWAVPTDFSLLVNEQYFELLHSFIEHIHFDDWRYTVFGNDITEPFIAYHRNNTSVSQGSPLASGTGYTWTTNIKDTNYNRSNEFQASLYLLDENTRVGSSANEDNILPRENDFSMSMFAWNRNTTDRYVAIFDTNRDGVELWMNSRNGVFSYGDVELIIYPGNAEYQTLSTTSQIVIDDGFHHIAFTRKGYELSIWIDGELKQTLMTAKIHNLGSFNKAYRVQGGPLYVNNWAVWANKAIESDLIELLYGGFNDFIAGKCTVDGGPLPSKLMASSVNTGEIYSSVNTDSDGEFYFKLPKTESKDQVNILAMAQDDNDSNNIVVHGPYNMTTIYSKYTDDQLDQTLSDMIIDMQPYVYYKMDETTGTTLSDSSGFGRNATLVNGVTPGMTAMGDEYKSLEFDGAGGYVDLPDGFDDFTDGFTYEGWVKFEAFNNYSRLLEVATGANGQNNIIIANEATSSNATIANVGLGDHLSATNAFNLSAWNHVVMRWAPNGTYSIWINGNNVDESSSSTNPPAVVTRTLCYLGKSTYSQDGYYRGNQSNVAIYDYPLSDEDIKKHAYRGFKKSTITLASLIEQDKPELYFAFDRTDPYIDKVNGITATQNGSFAIIRNSLVINKDTVANNWLTVPYRMDSSDEWTIEFSIKTGVTHTNGVIVSEWHQSTDTGTYKVELDASNLLKVYVNNGASVISSTTVFNDDQWHHVVIDYLNGGVALYVDGVFEASMSVAMAFDQHNLAIGNTSDGPASHAFEGATSLDDLAIYSHSIGTARITQHFNQFINKKVYQ